MSEIAGLLVGVKAMSEIVAGARPLIEMIRSGRHADTEQARQALAERVTRLEESLRQVGVLATIAASYGKALEDVLELLWLCERAQQVLTQTLDHADEVQESDHERGWVAFETLWAVLESRREIVRRSTLGLSSWYDNDDAGRMLVFLNRFNENYASASAFARSRQSSPLSDRVRSMTAELRDAEAVLRSTLYDRILATLQALR